MQAKKKYFMEKIETDIEKETIRNETMEKLFPKKVSVKKEKIKKDKVYKKMEKITELESTPKKGFNWLKIVLVAFILGCLLGLSGTAFYFYRQYKQALTAQNIISENKEDQAQKEAQSVKETIGNFMELPTDEEPILATVTDIEKIKNQPFFAKAQNGDKVLIYTNNKKAILYRPSIGKIIEASAVSGLNNNTNSTNPEPEIQNSETSSPLNETVDISPVAPIENSQINVEVPAVVAVYNGARIKGLAQKISDKVALISRVTISEKTNAQGSYQKTLVIDLSGNQAELAQKIATELGGEIGQLPEGETKPAADILVIAAKE
jgi:hypothetical protein